MIYFDNNATTAVAPEVLEAMMPYLSSSYGNASSAYDLGLQGRSAIEEARKAIASLLSANDPDEIVFTSCGTESDNWAITGSLAARPDKRHIISTVVEHDAVRRLLKKIEAQGYNVTWLKVDENGRLDLEQLRRSLSPDTALVSVMMANNETGILFPVNEIGSIVKGDSNAIFHVDGVNAVGKVSIDLSSTEIDLFSISAHKFHGPKGIGTLYIRRGVELAPSLIGGSQERGRRAGTEAVHQIAGIGAAANLAADLKPTELVRKLRDRLENEILDRIPGSRLNGTADRAARLPNTSSISFENTNGEMILHRLDELGVCVSTGSACNSLDHAASHVLAAMDIPYSWAMGSIRFSLGRNNTEAEVSGVLDVLPGIISELRQIGSRGT